MINLCHFNGNSITVKTKLYGFLVKDKIRDNL